jgi:hypothetical protein
MTAINDSPARRTLWTRPKPSSAATTAFLEIRPKVEEAVRADFEALVGKDGPVGLKAKEKRAILNLDLPGQRGPVRLGGRNDPGNEHRVRGRRRPLPGSAVYPRAAPETAFQEKMPYLIERVFLRDGVNH